jgi:3-methylcrotonyl-CoA carboxylase beta subunit
MRRQKAMESLARQIRAEEVVVAEGGGAEAVARQHAKGRLTARERLSLLLDPGAPFLEFGIHAAYEMYAEWGGAPAAGVITGVGKICRRDFMIIANDATVKAGSFFPMTAKKVIRAQSMALENCIPTIYLVDSAGIFLPLQEDVFPDTDDFGRVFYNNAVMSAKGIPQITAIMGSCVAGGAYLPVMCDKLLMTEGSGLYLAGPALVKAAIGQRISSEELGGAEVHASISGTIDFKEKDDPSCIARIRHLVDQMGVRPRAPFDRTDVSEPLYDPGEVYGVFADNPQDEYDTREILARIVDHSEFTEYKAEYGKTVITAYARVGGFAVGIVANQKMHVRQKGKKFEFGGVIYTESANKAARFVMDCNQNLIPLVFLHDVNGFMVGREAEHGGIIKAGARLVNVVSNSVVPKITVIMGGSFGAGHYAMCGKAYSPRFIYAWPTARYAVMGGDQAAGTLVDIKLKQLERSGQVLGEDEKRELFESVKRTYDHQTDPRYGAARLWVDKIIDPAQTRATLIRSLELTSLNPEIPKFNVGVLQT